MEQWMLTTVGNEDSRAPRAGNGRQTRFDNQPRDAGCIAHSLDQNGARSVIRYLWVSNPSCGMTFQLPLSFDEAAIAEIDIEERVETAILLLVEILRSDLLAIAWSSGKDSTTCLILALLAWLRAFDAGFDPPPLIVLHGDTLVESPPVRALADDMLASLMAWCESRAFRCSPSSTARPSTNPMRSRC